MKIRRIISVGENNKLNNDEMIISDTFAKSMNINENMLPLPIILVKYPVSALNNIAKLNVTKISDENQISPSISKHIDLDFSFDMVYVIIDDDNLKQRRVSSVLDFVNLCNTSLTNLEKLNAKSAPSEDIYNIKKLLMEFTKDFISDIYNNITVDENIKSDCVYSNSIYTVEEYFNLFLKIDTELDTNRGSFREFMDNNGYENLWDYPLDEISEVIENGHKVVLVEIPYVDDGVMKREVRWVQIPEK